MGICCKEPPTNQKLILNIPPITNEENQIISMQLNSNVVCKILGKKGLIGTGFFCKIDYKEQETFLPVLITNNHILNEDDLSSNQVIKLTFDDDKLIKMITLDESRITYTNDELDITIIEIDPDLDNIYVNNFLSIDENILFENSNQIYCQKAIYILQYPKGKKLSYSLGIVKMILNNEIEHLCSTENGSSGSPILNLANFKVIGVHRAADYKQDVNIGISFKYILEDFKKKYPILKNKNQKYINIIKFTIENDIENYDSDKTEISIFHTNSEINNSSTELYINEEKCEFGLFPTIKLEKGIYQAKLIINKVITDCNSLFSGCSNIISIDLSSFDSKKLTKMFGMFMGCEKLKNINLNNFDSRNVTNIQYTFSNCKNLQEVNLSSFNTENVENAECIFFCCYNLQKIVFSSLFNTKNVGVMTKMFYHCQKLKSLDLSSFDFQNVNNMGEMFEGCKELEEIKLLKFNANKCKNFSRMFYGCESLKQINSIETTNVIDMKEMLYSCKSLIEIDLSSCNTNNVKYMKSMFQSCQNLKSLDLSSFNTSNVEDMESMFENCFNLEAINLASFDTTKVTSMSKMFKNCKKLQSLDLSSFNTPNIKKTYQMFHGCEKFKIKDFPNIKDCGDSNYFGLRSLND